MKKIHNLKLFGLVAFLVFALVFIGIDFIEGQVKIQAKPDKPPGKDKKGDDGAFQDMPLCIVFNEGVLKPSLTNLNSLCASIKGVTASAGRLWWIYLKIHKRTSDPSLVLSSSWVALDPIEGDPDLPTGQLPILGTLGPDERISEPQLAVGIGVPNENIKDMQVGEYKWTGARLIFKDDIGDTYYLFWGSGPMPGGFQLTNPSAPDVYVIRNPDIIDIDGDDKSNWSVNTNAEVVGDRIGVHTAFLYGPLGYCGAFHVSFSYTAIEE